MAKSLYENLKIAFPELKNVPLPEELDHFEHLMTWLNTEQINLQRLDPNDLSLKQLSQCHRLQQLNIDLDELKNEIREELHSVSTFYEDDEEQMQQPLDAMYDSAISDNVILNTLQVFIEPYDLAVVVLGYQQPYWMIVPNQAELLQALKKSYTHIFGDEFSVLA